MPDIKVLDFWNVTIDGVHSGSIPDVLANHASVEGIRGAVAASHDAWQASIVDRHKDDIRARDDRHAEEIAGHRKALDGATASHAAAVAKIKADHDEQLKSCSTHYEARLAKQAIEIDGHKACAREIAQRYADLGGDHAWSNGEHGRKARAAATLAQAKAEYDRLHPPEPPARESPAVDSAPISEAAPAPVVDPAPAPAPESPPLVAKVIRPGVKITPRPAS